jgi:probable rRNA maturation factor
MPYPIEVDIIRHDEAWPNHLDGLAHLAVEQALETADPDMTGPAELSILLTNDAEQQALNGQWRGKNVPTNVLSFPQLAPFSPLEGMIGDISLARETLLREASAEDKPFDHHFVHLVVHGLLHILGYDHLTDEEAAVMEQMESKILWRLGIPDPYETA